MILENPQAPQPNLKLITGSKITADYRQITMIFLTWITYNTLGLGADWYCNHLTAA
jgi:hypothetical protein